MLCVALTTATLALPQLAKADNIVETAAKAGTFQTLLAAAKAAGLADALATSPSLTVFAPSDAAFDALPKGTVETLLKPENKEKLKAILSYHVVASKVLAKDVPTALTPVATLNGAKVPVIRNGNQVRVGTARVVTADVIADNGVIHVIDSVLMPPAPKAAAAPVRRPAASYRQQVSYRRVAESCHGY
jgi:uncharacterized surface protein with fasciclin (FAS1) repeats